MSDNVIDLSEFSTPFPNAARIYDYTLGGTVNFAPDRGAAEGMFQLIPSTQKWVRMLRAFIQEAAKSLHAEGFEQFLDLASGLPTQDHIHAVLPTARVVYSDIDPLTVRYGQLALAGNPLVRYLEGDVTNLQGILGSTAVAELINLEQKVAIGFNGINVFLTPTQIQQIAQELYAWAPAGSKIFLNYETRNPEKTTLAFEQFLGMFAATGSPMHLHSLEENLAWMAPWQVEKVAPVDEFLGYPPGYVTEADHEGVDLQFYAAIMTK
jgi:hypothetical protein